MNEPLTARLWNEYERRHADLRNAIERLERAGELRRIRGAVLDDRSPSHGRGPLYRAAGRDQG